jgi:DNA topoisomerase IB
MKALLEGNGRAVARLRRSDLGAPGIVRRRCGKGFHYRWHNGAPVADPETQERIRALAIPPAWKDVWICPWPNGHIQAVGVDAAGRRQYRYHDTWRAHRDREKFDRALEFAQDLPRLRATVERDLRRPGADRRRVLAAVVRLLDLGAFRVGGMEYVEANDTYGLVTLRKSHVRLSGDTMHFEYPAKCSIERVFATADADVLPVVRSLRRRRSGSDQLFAYKDKGHWVDLRSDDVNAYIKEECGERYSAKDFRNWTATVLAAALVSECPVPRSQAELRRGVNGVVKEVAEHLGNTPAVCRSSYIDPRIFDRYAGGSTISSRLAARLAGELTNGGRAAVESAVVDLLADDGRQAVAA